MGDIVMADANIRVIPDIIIWASIQTVMLKSKRVWDHSPFIKAYIDCVFK